MQSQTYIVRIYASNRERGLAGIVEIVRTRKIVSFQSFEQLRAVLERWPRDARLTPGMRKVGR